MTQPFDEAAYYSLGAPYRKRRSLKHGFYSPQFQQIEIDDLKTHQFVGLNDEISMLRICIRRMMECLEVSGDPYECIKLIRLVCLASQSLARMIRAQDAMPKPGNPIDKTFAGNNPQWSGEAAARVDPPCPNPGIVSN